MDMIAAKSLIKKQACLQEAGIEYVRQHMGIHYVPVGFRANDLVYILKVAMKFEVPMAQISITSNDKGFMGWVPVEHLKAVSDPMEAEPPITQFIKLVDLLALDTSTFQLSALDTSIKMVYYIERLCGTEQALAYLRAMVNGSLHTLNVEQKGVLEQYDDLMCEAETRKLAPEVRKATRSAMMFIERQSGSEVALEYLRNAVKGEGK